LDVDGRVLLSDLERDAAVTLRPEVKTIETVGGYMMARLARPAEPGERVECEGYTLIAIDVAGRRVRRVRIVSTPPAEAASTDGATAPEQPAPKA
jgi:CBS domain containing-hemolysin-like protein